MDRVHENRLTVLWRRLPTALQRPAIPLADLGLLRRPLLRTTVIRLGLLVALAALAAVSLKLNHSNSSPKLGAYPASFARAIVRRNS